MIPANITQRIDTMDILTTKKAIAIFTVYNHKIKIALYNLQVANPMGEQAQIDIDREIDRLDSNQQDCEDLLNYLKIHAQRINFNSSFGSRFF